MGVDYIRGCYRRLAQLFTDDPTSYWIRWKKCVPQAKTLPFSTPYSSAIWDSNGAPPVEIGEKGKRVWIEDEYSEEPGQSFVGPKDGWHNGFTSDILSRAPVGTCPPVLKVTLPWQYDAGIELSIVQRIVDAAGDAPGARSDNEQVVHDSAGDAPGATESVSTSASASSTAGDAPGATESVSSSGGSSDPAGLAPGAKESVSSSATSSSTAGIGPGATEVVHHHP